MLVYEPYGGIDFFERTTLVILYTDRTRNNMQSDAADSWSATKSNANRYEYSESTSAVNGSNITTIQIRFFMIIIRRR